MRSAIFAARVAGILLLTATGARSAGAQAQPTKISTLVARAMVFFPDPFGHSEFFDTKLPTAWPAALVPRNAKILGGGAVGEKRDFWMRVAVFEIAGREDPKSVVRKLVESGGYARVTPGKARGGFIGSLDDVSGNKFCKGDTAAVTFGLIDSASAPRAIALTLMEGEVTRENCRPGDELMRGRPPVTIPTLTPPPGASVSYGDMGSGWGGSSGSTTSAIRTSMPADSVLAHYSRQLVAGGWNAEGKPAAADGAGVQRFSFHDGDHDWSAMLTVLAAGDKRDLMIRYTRID